MPTRPLILPEWVEAQEAPGKNSSRVLSNFTSLGNALHQLQSIAAPPAKYVITEMLDEEDEADDDNQGGTANAKTHLLRQAARIRRGERLERLTALTKGKNVKDG